MVKQPYFLKFFNSMNLAAFCLLVILICIFVYVVVDYFHYKSKEYTQEGFEYANNDEVKIGIISMIKNPKNIETWLKKNRENGVSHFYIRLEDSPEVMDFLQDQQDVTLQIGNGSGNNEYNEIQTRQEKMVNHFLEESQKDDNHLEWLIHMDSDELLDGDLDEIRQLPSNVHTFWMQNEEAKFDKVPGKEDNCFHASKFYDCAKDPGKCVSYGNGKSGARVCKETRSNGPHRCKSLSPSAKEVKLEKVKIKHFESCDFDSYKKKYMNLSKQDDATRKDIPFPYYKDSIDAALSGNDENLKKIYTKYRVEK